MATATSLPPLYGSDSTYVPRVSPTLAAGADLEARRRRGERVLPMGFGEAGLPVLPVLRQALADAASSNRYGPVAGHEALRAAAAGYWTRRGLPTDPAMVVCGPGSKALLFGLLAGMDGDIAIPRPSWVSYAAQALLTGRHPVYVDACSPGGVPDPGALAAAVKSAASAGRRIAAVIVTLPDNPTATLAAAPLLRDLCDVAQRHDLLVISDEIYRDLVYEPRSFVSPAELLPDRTVITSGLSKNLALGGWRLGVARMPSAPLRERLLAVASEIWSAPAGPVQEAAAVAFAEGPEVSERIRMSRNLHARVCRAVASLLSDAGALAPEPQGAFYAYPDFGAHRETLRKRHGVTTGAGLSALLLRRYGIGVIAGSAFGEPEESLCLRLATSCLYGDAEAEQEAALAAGDPLTLPWIADALRWLSESLTDLVG